MQWKCLRHSLRFGSELFAETGPVRRKTKHVRFIRKWTVGRGNVYELVLWGVGISLLKNGPCLWVNTPYTGAASSSESSWPSWTERQTVEQMGSAVRHSYLLHGLSSLLGWLNQMDVTPLTLALQRLQRLGPSLLFQDVQWFIKRSLKQQHFCWFCIWGARVMWWLRMNGTI